LKGDECFDVVGVHEDFACSGATESRSPAEKAVAHVLKIETRSTELLPELSLCKLRRKMANLQQPTYDL
jgi:hypothetical protein